MTQLGFTKVNSETLIDFHGAGLTREVIGKLWPE